ncbi:MAG: MATE family efflux transporter [Bacteroidales bacterium]|nr:MATE family efflux transporter [Bacteroidales bacterium]
MFDNRDSIDFRAENIPALFRSIFIPTLLGMLFNAAFTLTDGIFVGHGVGAEGLACINLVAPIMMVITGLGMMLGIGCSVVAAIHLAKDNVKAARINVTQSYIAAIAGAAVLSVVFYAAPHRVLSLLGVSEQLMALAREYYLWFIPTCVFLMLQIVGEFVIRLDGSPRYAMYANIIPAIVNIGLDYTFILPCGWGLRGAALATDIGTGLGALMALYYMLFRAKSLRLYRLKWTWTSLRLMARNVGYIARMGFSALVGELAISVMMLAGNLAFGHALGDTGIAAYSVVCYLFPAVYMICSAVAQSAQPIISFNHGDGAPGRVRRTFLHSLGVNLAFGAAVTLLFIFLAPQLIGIFIPATDPAALLAVEGLPIYAAGLLFMAFNISAIGYFQSVERSAFATLLMALRGILLLVPAFLVLPGWWHTPGLWLAVPIAEMLTALVAAIALAPHKKS